MKKAAVPSILLAVILLAFAVITEAQRREPIARIGYLAAGPAPVALVRVRAFREGLRALGYVEGRDLVIEYRNAAGRLDQVPRNAAELIRLNVKVIVTAGPTDTKAAKKATTTIPIVMAFDSDPVGNGFVASLARPGGNITGLSILAPELSGKRLELLKETLPSLSRVAVFGTSTEPGNAQSLKEAELAAGVVGVQLHYLEVKGPAEIEAAFRAARKERAEAVLVLSSAVLTRRKKIVDLATKNRLPAIYDRREFVEVGGLLAYGVSLADLDRRAASYVDKILKGTKAADLPVEQPTKFEFVINLKTAKQIGLTIPQNVLARADKVIK